MDTLTKNFISPGNDKIRRQVLAKIGPTFSRLDGDADDIAVARELVEIGAAEVRIVGGKIEFKTSFPDLSESCRNAH